MLTIKANADEAIHVLTTEELEKHDLAVTETACRDLAAAVVAVRKTISCMEQEARAKEDLMHGFIGYVCGALPELHHVEVPRVAKLFEEFKAKWREQAFAENACPVEDRQGRVRVNWSVAGPDRRPVLQEYLDKYSTRSELRLSEQQRLAREDHAADDRRWLEREVERLNRQLHRG